MNPNTKANYLENPDKCPNCGGENLTADDFDVNVTTQAYRKVTCNKCGAKFEEIFQLADVVKIN